MNRHFANENTETKSKRKFQANGKATLEVYSQGDPQASDYECGIWVPVQAEGRL